MLGASALVLAIALGGCRGGSARNGGNNGNSGVTVTQSATGTGSSGATSTTGSSGPGSSAALRQLEQIDSQNQTDQQQLGSAGSDAGVDYSSQDSPIQP